MLTSICPILPSADFEETKAFVQNLGFDFTFEYEVEGYLIFVRDGVELHYTRDPNHIASMSNHSVFVRVKDANALSEEFKKLNIQTCGIPRLCLAEDKPWGLCELAVIDPDGNLLCMGHILS